MKGVRLRHVKLKRPRKCAHYIHKHAYLQAMTRSVGRDMSHKYRFRRSPDRALQPSALYTRMYAAAVLCVLLSSGLSLFVLIGHHRLLFLLMAVVWTVTAWLAARMVRRNLHQFRMVLARLRRYARYARVAWQVVVSRLHLALEQVVSRFKCPPTWRKKTPILSRSAMPLHFPDTPMPATPLIRVLETIDLSSTGVEHFLGEIEQAQKQAEQEQEQQYRRNSSHSEA